MNMETNELTFITLWPSWSLTVPLILRGEKLKLACEREICLQGRRCTFFIPLIVKRIELTSMSWVYYFVLICLRRFVIREQDVLDNPGNIKLTGEGSQKGTRATPITVWRYMGEKVGRNLSPVLGAYYTNTSVPYQNVRKCFQMERSDEDAIL